MMKHIRRFTESEISEISPDRVQEVIEFCEKIVVDVDQKCEDINSLLNEFEEFKNKSQNNNDQIDDSIVNLQLSKKNLEETKSKIDNVSVLMKDYNQNGRKFLY